MLVCEIRIYLKVNVLIPLHKMNTSNGNNKKKNKRGILRLDINKPRSSSGGSVEFRSQPELLGQVKIKFIFIERLVTTYLFFYNNLMIMPIICLVWNSIKSTSFVKVFCIVLERRKNRKVYRRFEHYYLW